MDSAANSSFQSPYSIHNFNHLPAVWNCILEKYVIDKIQGEGSFGQVVKAYPKGATAGDVKPVAIKYIKRAFQNAEHGKRVYREIAILR